MVACPTGTMAGQLADDLAQFLPAGQVARVPGVGDAAVRAGEPVGRDDGSAPRGAVAAARPRALPGGRSSPACGPCCSGSVPAPTTSSRSSCARATSSTPTSSCSRLVNFGYRREELVEHRGEFARRGAIIDVFPSTGDAPIRIDLWGDEVDRLTRSASTTSARSADLAEALIFPARELIPTDDVRARAPTLVGRRAVGPRAVGAARRGRAVRRHGELAAVARRRPSSCSPTCCPTTAKVVLVEPRRMRDRAVDLLAEEDDLAKALASTWGATPTRRSPACTPSPTGCSPARGAALVDRLGARVARTRRSSRRPAGGRSSATATGSSTA